MSPMTHVNHNDSYHPQGVKDRFPRGGAMGLLESHPELIEKYSALAHRFVQHGYLAPMNVLWTYYFINGMQVRWKCC